MVETVGNSLRETLGRHDDDDDGDDGDDGDGDNGDSGNGGDGSGDGEDGDDGDERMWMGVRTRTRMMWRMLIIT